MDMYYYFSSEYPSAVKINGAFLGVISQEVKFCSISEFGAFIEICSLLPTEPSVNFLLTKEFLSSPPENISITDLKGGFLINCKPLNKGGMFAMLAQEKTDYAVVSVFIDNGLKVSLETPCDFFADEIPLSATSAEIKYFSVNNKPFVAITFISDKTYLAVYSLNDKICKHLFLQVQDFSTENGLTTTEKRADMAKHVITTNWNTDGEFKADSVSVTCADGFSATAIPISLVPYTFIEELLAGGDATVYLSDNVKRNADKLKGYLGEFIGVMPPPIFRDSAEVGLIYKSSRNIYEVCYFTFEFTENKIDNIIKSER